ncbi:MAG: hypothetical protein WCJ49_09025, partial [Deltaproteobacteria bacterium]
MNSGKNRTLGAKCCLSELFLINFSQRQRVGIDSSAKVISNKEYPGSLSHEGAYYVSPWQCSGLLMDQAVGFPTVNGCFVMVYSLRIGPSGTLHLSGWLKYCETSLIKISDVSGALSGSGGAISIKAWDVNGKSLVESDGAAPLKLNNHATT